MSRYRKRLWAAPVIAAAITLAATGTAVALDITGTDARDRIIGSRGTDTIAALAGPDRVFALAGDDGIDAGLRDDGILAGPSQTLSWRPSATTVSSRAAAATPSTPVGLRPRARPARRRHDRRRRGFRRAAPAAAGTRCRAGPGSDRLIAAARIGPATDTVGGDEGDDRIFVRDGHRDVVTCGPGFDRVQADSADSIAADCEW